MTPPRVLLIVLAGGKGSRLGPLTVGRAKPALPIGGHHRLIDVALSNAAHSGIRDVWVLEQYQPHMLDEHLAGGRPWDLDRTRGGFRTLPPFESGGDRDGGLATGNTDALARNWQVVEAFDPDVLLVVSADHLFLLDHRRVVEAHLDGGFDATVVTTVLPRGTDVSRYLVVQEADGRVRAVDYKPDDPVGRTVGTEVFAYRPDALGEHLRALEAEGGDLGDYGDRLLPALVDGGAVGALAHDGYWRDLGTPASYLDGNLDLVGLRPRIRLDDPTWPILTSMPVRAPALVQRGAELDDAHLSPGAAVAGKVVDSVIGPGARVEAGAEVRHSVVMADAVVRRGSVVQRSVVAEDVVVGRGSVLGAANATHPVLVGAGRHLPPGTELPAGAHLEPTRSRRVVSRR